MPLQGYSQFFSGCILEWRLADILHGFVTERARSFFALSVYGSLCRFKDTASFFPAVSLSGVLPILRMVL
jgi:hypothetical protein